MAGTFVEHVNQLATTLTPQLVQDIATVGADSGSINTVAGMHVEIQNLLSRAAAIDSLYLDKATLDSLYADKAKLDSLFADKLKLDSLYTDKAVLDSIYADKAGLDTVYANMAEILLADDNAVIATAGATQAQLRKWEAQAERMTADSYATEVEDVFVKVYTSVGDGTFTSVNTAEYSSLHWSAKASTLVTTGIIDDSTTALNRTYSSVKVQALHDAQATAISNLSGASATFANTVTQPIPEDPAAFVDLTWTNGQASTNTAILDLGVNTFILKQNGTYNFLNTLTFYRISDGSVADVTFEIYDTVATTVLATYTQHIDMIAGTKNTVPMNALLNISGLTAGGSITAKVRMRSTTVNGTIELFSFNSIIALSSITNTATIDAINTALGTIYEGLA